jgi:thymidylate kinase
MDLNLGTDLYESFSRYQTRLLAIFDRLAETYRFSVIDANGPIDDVFAKLRRRIVPLLSDKRKR